MRVKKRKSTTGLHKVKINTEKEKNINMGCLCCEAVMQMTERFQGCVFCLQLCAENCEKKASIKFQHEIKLHSRKAFSSANRVHTRNSVKSFF